MAATLPAQNQWTGSGYQTLLLMDKVYHFLKPKEKARMTTLCAQVTKQLPRKLTHYKICPLQMIAELSVGIKWTSQVALEFTVSVCAELELSALSEELESLYKQAPIVKGSPGLRPAINLVKELVSALNELKHVKKEGKALSAISLRVRSLVLRILLVALARTHTPEARTIPPLAIHSYWEWLLISGADIAAKYHRKDTGADFLDEAFKALKGAIVDENDLSKEVAAAIKKSVLFEIILLLKAGLVIDNDIGAHPYSVKKADKVEDEWDRALAHLKKGKTPKCPDIQPAIIVRPEFDLKLELELVNNTEFELDFKIRMGAVLAPWEDYCADYQGFGKLVQAKRKEPATQMEVWLACGATLFDIEHSLVTLASHEDLADTVRMVRSFGLEPDPRTDPYRDYYETMLKGMKSRGEPRNSKCSFLSSTQEFKVDIHIDYALQDKPCLLEFKSTDTACGGRSLYYFGRCLKEDNEGYTISLYNLLSNDVVPTCVEGVLLSIESQEALDRVDAFAIVMMSSLSGYFDFYKRFYLEGQVNLDGFYNFEPIPRYNRGVLHPGALLVFLDHRTKIAWFWVGANTTQGRNYNQSVHMNAKAWLDLLSRKLNLSFKEYAVVDTVQFREPPDFFNVFEKDYRPPKKMTTADGSELPESLRSFVESEPQQPAPGGPAAYPAAPAGAAYPCRRCGAPMVLVPQYNLWHCGRCGYLCPRCAQPLLLGTDGRLHCHACRYF